MEDGTLFRVFRDSDHSDYQVKGGSHLYINYDPDCQKFQSIKKIMSLAVFKNILGKGKMDVTFHSHVSDVVASSFRPTHNPMSDIQQPTALTDKHTAAKSTSYLCAISMFTS